MDTKKHFNVGDVVRHTNLPDRTYKVIRASEGMDTRVEAHSFPVGGYYTFLTKNLELISAAPQQPSGPNSMVSLEGIKATNPKDAIGSSKLSFHLVPDTAKVYMALAFTEGALKYGSSNWRVAGVRASIYKSAAERHLAKYWNGEWADPKTGVPHLASVMACCAIILDANLAKKLTDDRPPKVDMAGLIDGLEPVIKNLQDQFKDFAQKNHYGTDAS